MAWGRPGAFSCVSHLEILVFSGKLSFLEGKSTIQPHTQSCREEKLLKRKASCKIKALFFCISLLSGELRGSEAERLWRVQHTGCCSYLIYCCVFFKFWVRFSCLVPVRAKVGHFFHRYLMYRNETSSMMPGSPWWLRPALSWRVSLSLSKSLLVLAEMEFN